MFRFRSGWVVSAIVAVVIVSVFAGVASSQGLPQSPYSAPSLVRGDVLDLAPSNPLGLPRASATPRTPSSLLFTPQMFRGILPLIPNLQLGYLYDFGNSVESGRLTADFLLPIRLNDDSVVFGEAHGEFQDFWKRATGGSKRRTDLSFGGGFRTIRSDSVLVGVNGFYDTTVLGKKSYGSWGVGFETAALLPGNDALDINFNWYGNMFKANTFANAFRRGPSNFDFEAGYSHELYHGGPDLRLNLTGYKFSVDNGIYGVRGGAELRTRDGMFVVKYEAGDDKINGTYHTIGGFVNVGLQLENLFTGNSPFVLPEPIFRSPRSLRRLLTEKVRRNWHQSAAILTGGLVRYVTAASVTTNAGGTYTWPGLGSTEVAFPPVPYTSLVGTQFITVEFDYSWSVPAPPGATVDIVVMDVIDVERNAAIGMPVPGSSGHVGPIRMTAYGPQQNFIGVMVDPASMRINDINGGPPGAVFTLSNVRFTFNQP